MFSSMSRKVSKVRLTQATEMSDVSVKGWPMETFRRLNSNSVFFKNKQCVS